MAKIKYDVDRILGYLRALIIDRPNNTLKDVGGHKTYEREVLKQILLHTGGEHTIINQGTIHHTKVCHKHIGVGVYHVWLEK